MSIPCFGGPLFEDLSKGPERSNHFNDRQPIDIEGLESQHYVASDDIKVLLVQSQHEEPRKLILQSVNHVLSIWWQTVNQYHTEELELEVLGFFDVVAPDEEGECWVLEHALIDTINDGGEGCLSAQHVVKRQWRSAALVDKAHQIAGVEDLCHDYMLKEV